MEVAGATVAEALRDLTSRYPQLRRHLYDDHGRLRGFVNVFVNEEDVRDLEGEATRLRPGDTLTILPSVAGGRDRRQNPPARYDPCISAGACRADAAVGPGDRAWEPGTEHPRQRDVTLNGFAGQGEGRLSKRMVGALLAAACTFVVLGVVAVRAGNEETRPVSASSASESAGAAEGVEVDPEAGGAGDGGTAAGEGHDASALPGAADPAQAAASADGAAPGNGAVDDVGAAPFPPQTRPSPPPNYGEPVPPEARVPKPEAVRGIYLNAWAAGSRARRQALIELAEKTEINTFVIDVKDATGYVSYRTRSELARTIGADREIRIANIREVLDDLRARGIYPIARIVVFKDPLLAEARPDLAIQRADGTVWVDHHGEKWVDPYNREIWDYNIELAREAVELGFSEVQWDYVRFPDVPQSYMREAVYPARQDRSRVEAIREFLSYSREALKDLGVPVTADVFGLTTSAGDDMGIGQKWEQLVDVTDVLLPMVYPSHYARGSYGIAYPNANPYTTVKIAIEHALRRTKGVEGAAAIRPWLQDFTLGSPRYGPEHVRAQIRAVYDAGLTEWILWNPGSRYTAAALAPEGGPAPDFPIPDPGPPQRTPAPPDTAIKLLGEPVKPPVPDTLRR